MVTIAKKNVLNTSEIVKIMLFLPQLLYKGDLCLGELYYLLLTNQ